MWKTRVYAKEWLKAEVRGQIAEVENQFSVPQFPVGAEALNLCNLTSDLIPPVLHSSDYG